METLRWIICLKTGLVAELRESVRVLKIGFWCFSCACLGDDFWVSVSGVFVGAVGEGVGCAPFFFFFSFFLSPIRFVGARA